MKPVLLFGAIDRFNYGDLLLPVLLKARLEALTGPETPEVRVFGCINSDLRTFGALPTKSIRDLYAALQEKPSYVLVVGGEVLSPKWSAAYSNLEMPAHAWYDRTKSFRRINNQICKKILGGKGRRPFILETKHFPLLQGVLYNSVGGKRNGRYKGSDRKNLQEALYVSCRDKAVYEVVKKDVPFVQLAPDSAILMSLSFSMERLSELVSPGIKSLFTEKPVFFQVSYDTAKELGIQALAQKLSTLQASTGKMIVLCPIGKARGHDDPIALSALKEILKPDTFVLIQNPSLWDIMGLIAHASLYVGGSLHGIITAMSYDVPYLFLRNRPKLISYVNTWGSQSLKGLTTLENWNERIQDALTVSKEELQETRQIQLHTAEKSVKDMLRILTT
jgi:hypothetical protein